jgi:hypothetical protein
MQSVDGARSTTAQAVRALYADGGVRAFFRGTVPRLARVAWCVLAFEWFAPLHCVSSAVIGCMVQFVVHHLFCARASQVVAQEIRFLISNCVASAPLLSLHVLSNSKHLKTLYLIFACFVNKWRMSECSSCTQCDSRTSFAAAGGGSKCSCALASTSDLYKSRNTNVNPASSGLRYAPTRAISTKK